MKKISRISIVILSLFLAMFGCSDQLINEPELPQISNELNKISHLPLPYISQEISITKTIVGLKGGTIVLNGLYKNSDNKVITVYANLKIPRNAFQGIETITIKTDSTLAALKFEPAMKFDKPLNLNLEFTNLDLNALDLTHDVKFVFMGDDGTIELTQNVGVKINLAQGALVVLNAKLEHFSRFGFTR